MSRQGSIFDEEPIPDIPETPDFCAIGQKPLHLNLNQKIMDFFLTLGLAITDEQKDSVQFEISHLKILLLSKLTKILTISPPNYMAEFDKHDYKVKIKADITDHSPECQPLVWQIRALIKTQKEATEPQIEAARSAILKFIENGGRLNLTPLKQAAVRILPPFLDRLTDTILELRKEYKELKLKTEQEYLAETPQQNPSGMSYASLDRTQIEPPTVFITENLSLGEMHDLAQFRANRTPKILG